MARTEIRFRSEILGKKTTVTVVHPDNVEGPCNVMYLLHGLSGDHASYANDFPLEGAVNDLPILAVCPDGDRSYYVNETAPGGNCYEDFVTQELPAFIDRTFHTVAHRDRRMLAGLSMGGYGAMMLALKHPDVFGAAYSSSGSLYFAETDQHPTGSEYPEVLMDSLNKDDYSVLKLADRLKEAEASLRIKFDCGMDDYLLPINRKFQLHLEKLGIPHEYGEFPGAHDHGYWLARFPEMMAFAREVFDLPATEG